MKRRISFQLVLTTCLIFWTLNFLNTFLYSFGNNFGASFLFEQPITNGTKSEIVFAYKSTTRDYKTEDVLISRRNKQCKNTEWQNSDRTGNVTQEGVDNLHLGFHPMLFKFSQLYENGGIDCKLILYGQQRQKPGFLTLGIPTVKRRFNDYYYLNVTVSGLIQNIDPEMVRQIVIVIFMADSDISWNMRTAQKIFLTFQPQFESGLLQIIHISPNVYPQFSLLRKMGTDSVERVRWRTKQNVDFALVMLYSRSLNTYYMQLEDDLSVAPDFFNDIQSYVQKQKGNWFLLEFSTLGFIGKLFHSHHLFSIASYLLKNFQKRPCDLMLGQLRDRFGQSKILFSGVSLFQHIGKISTLNNKIMPAVDKKFKNFGSHTPLIMKLPDGGVRPEATFKTNMRIISRFPPENVYKNNSHFYTDVVKRNHYFQILFKEHLNMSRLLISTGSSLNKAHILNNGILKIGANEERGTFCRNVHYIGKFVNGEIDTLIQGFKLPLNIDCIHIEVTRSQRFPLIIRDLKVYLEKIPGIYTASIL